MDVFDVRNRVTDDYCDFIACTDQLTVCPVVIGLVAAHARGQVDLATGRVDAAPRHSLLGDLRVGASTSGRAGPEPADPSWAGG